MTNSKIDVKTKTSSVKNDKTKKQDEEFAQLSKQKEDAKKKAKENQEKAKKEQLEKQAEKEKQEALEKQKNDKNEKIADIASEVIESVSSSKKNKSFKDTVITLVIGIIIGFLIATFFGFGKVEENEVVNSQNLDETILTHTDVDFKDVIIGEARQRQELIVMENPLEISTTITKSGLGGLSIFSKVKDITYHGRGLYTVDMSKIDKEHISVDKENKVVSVTIPHAILQEVILDVNDIEFSDTENGLLSFGDLALTSEQQNLIEVTVRKSMEEALNNQELFEKADEFAKLKTWQIFQPLVSAISNEYIVEIVIK